jgi:hypothetical protein
MADNVAITAGSGTSIATDDVSGAHYQKMKIYDGTADSAYAAIVDSSGNLQVEATNPSITGTAGSANSGVLSVQGIASMTPVLFTPAAAVDYANGKTRVSLRVAVTASGTGTTVWDPTTGKKFILTKLWVSAKTAGDIQIFDSTDSGNTVVTPIVTLNAGGGYIVEWPVWAPYRSATVDNILKYTTGTVITGSIYVEGWEE